MTTKYVHGYAERERTRLCDQANALVEHLHFDTHYPDGHTVLEAGCGVGAQTAILARRAPNAVITSVDLSERALVETRRVVSANGLTNVTVRRADILDLPFANSSFDHVFVSFVLEHLSQPLEALYALQRVLKPGGTITAIEGDHGSTYFYPNSVFARRAVQCLVDLQAMGGGNALIGRSLYPLLENAGFENVQVSPRMVYVDASKPDLVDGFIKHTFTAMVEGVRDDAIAAGLISEANFDRGIEDLYRTAEGDGVFCYTFFKATAFAEARAASD